MGAHEHRQIAAGAAFPWRAMAITNLQLFEMINAGPDLGSLPRLAATFAADWLSDCIGVGLLIAFLRGDRALRIDVLEMVGGLLLALALSKLVMHLWPHPRPFMLGLGTQYLAHGPGPSLPSHHTTSMWALALSAFATRRMARWGWPLLAVGLLVGWSRVFLGVHFPYDVLAAFPVALLGTIAAHGIRTEIRTRHPRLYALITSGHSRPAVAQARL